MGERLTVRQLYAACQNNRYLLLRLPCGGQVGVNCRVASIAQRRNPQDWNGITKFISFRPCNIAEYIEHKIPFM